MGLACGARLSKYLLFSFNLVFIIAGFAGLGVGIWVLVDNDSISNMASVLEQDDTKVENLEGSSNVVKQGAIMLILTAVFVFGVSFLGFWGAIYEKRVLLVIYAGCLVIVLGMMISAGIFSLVFSNEAEEKFRTGFVNAVKKFYDGDENVEPPREINAFTKTLNVVMMKFKCCGVYNDSDFTNGALGLGSENNDDYRLNGVVPLGCCILIDPDEWVTPKASSETCQTEPIAGENIHGQGCYIPVKGWLKANVTMLVVFGFLVGIIQLFGIAFAITLCWAIGKDDFDDD